MAEKAFKPLVAPAKSSDLSKTSANLNINSNKPFLYSCISGSNLNAGTTGETLIYTVPQGYVAELIQSSAGFSLSADHIDGLQAPVLTVYAKKGAFRTGQINLHNIAGNMSYVYYSSDNNSNVVLPAGTEIYFKTDYLRSGFLTYNYNLILKEIQQ